MPPLCHTAFCPRTLLKQGSPALARGDRNVSENQKQGDESSHVIVSRNRTSMKRGAFSDERPGAALLATTRLAMPRVHA
jgi:hypothetical protein